MTEYNSIKITRAGYEALGKLSDRTGINKTELPSRLLIWLEKQSPTLQAVILDQTDPKHNKQILRMILGSK